MSAKAEIKSKQLSFRLTPEAVNQAYYLAHIWSPVKPLSLADVVIESIRRAHEAESKAGKKAR